MLPGGPGILQGHVRQLNARSWTALVIITWTLVAAAQCSTVAINKVRKCLCTSPLTATAVRLLTNQQDYSNLFSLVIGQMNAQQPLAMMVQRVLLQKCYYLPAKGETRDQDLDSQNRGKLNFLFRLPGLDGSGDAVAAASMMPVCLFIVIVDCNCSRSTNTHTRRIHFQVQHF